MQLEATAHPVAPEGRRMAETISFPVVAGLIRCMDLLILGLAGLLSTGLVSWMYGTDPQGPVTIASFAGAVAANISMARDKAYAQSALVSGPRQIRLMLKPLVIGAAWLVGCLFVFYQGRLPFRIWPLAWAGTAAVLIGGSRIPLTRLMRHWTAAGRLARKIAIVGVNDFSGEFIDRLKGEPGKYQVIGIFDDRMSRAPLNQSDVAVRGTVDDLVVRSREEQIDIIVIALPLSAPDRIRAVVDQLSSTVADIVLTTDLAGLRFSRTQFEGIGRNPVVSIRKAPLKDWRALQKMLVDYGLGSLALLVLSPVLLLTALLIKLDSPGPVLFRQPRMGFNNRLFLCYKFRSMRHGAADLLADKQTTRGDPRITRVGRVIRKLSIDELPQLFNVLNGTMSLVGPRPHAPNTKAADQLFADVVQQYAVRHRVKPGITGWAQVNGWRGETATIEQIEQRVACDLFYIENWSVRFDLKIMALTLLREVSSRHAF
jgi:Undecaprenyl-phosphate glucose phosphotransferase